MTQAQSELDRWSVEELLESIEGMTEPLCSTASTNQDRQLLIAMEELCEMAIEVSRCLRGRGDRVGILEELADAVIVISNIKRILAITDDELNKAIQVKIEEALRKKAELEDKNLH